MEKELLICWGFHGALDGHLEGERQSFVDVVFGQFKSMHITERLPRYKRRNSQVDISHHE